MNPLLADVTFPSMTCMNVGPVDDQCEPATAGSKPIFANTSIELTIVVGSVVINLKLAWPDAPALTTSPSSLTTYEAPVSVNGLDILGMPAKSDVPRTLALGCSHGGNVPI